MIDLRRISFGGTAALVMSMGLIVGLDAASAGTNAVLSSLLIVGIADNLTDSLSIHVYQESENLPAREAFRTTAINFIARLCVTFSFVSMLISLPSSVANVVCILWGFGLLSTLSYFLARRRGASPLAEIAKHGAVAVSVIFISKVIGTWIFNLTNLISLM